MRLVPYGETCLRNIIDENSYYIDKTDYIRKLEGAGKYLVFLRPRRFGKSLWLDTLRDYYDVLNAPNFEKEFAELAAGKNPTPLHSKFLILNFNFSMVDKTGSLEDIQQSFARHCRLCISDFLARYAPFLPEGNLEAITAQSSPTYMMEALSKLAARSGQAIYVLIDEYDNFANAVLADSHLGPDGYRTLTHGMGFFRNFFTFLKGATTGSDGGISRIFITGVSPLTLDDVTSGFNMGRNISLNPKFAGMLGVTENEARDMLEYYMGEMMDNTPVEERMETLRLWYNNYHFSRTDIETPAVYNTDMLLYFFAEYVDKGGRLPDEMVDNNVKTDYGKLKQLIFWEQKLNGNFSALCQLAEENQVSASLVTTFGLEQLGDMDAFVSLLFYLGLVTISGADEGNILFSIPNQTIRSMLYGYIRDALKELPELNVNLQDIIAKVRAMGLRGAWEDALDCLGEQTARTLSVRDLVVREKGPQLVHLIYLGIPKFFIARCEMEARQGYADLVLTPDHEHTRGIKHSYILEFKYINTRDAAPPAPDALANAFAQAFTQLQKYRADTAIQKACGNTQLHTIAIVYSGAKLLEYREMPASSQTNILS